MKYHPILFNTEMVRAILDGRKTQTRRVVKTLCGCPDFYSYQEGHPYPYYFRRRDAVWDSFKTIEELTAKYCPLGQVGDRLVVIELREIPNIPSNKYLAGSDGNIYSFKNDWKVVKSHTTNNGYKSLSICCDGKKSTKNVHRLICAAFHGLPVDESYQVRHLDGNRQNNIPSNLTWGTQAENWQDRKAHGNGIEGEKHHSAKFTNAERDHIRWAIEKGLCSQRHAAKALNVSPSSISQICNSPETSNDYIAMPRWASRITLEITDVRIERIQDISEEDAIAEGVESSSPCGGCGESRWGNCIGCLHPWDDTPISAFQSLWQSVYGTWDVNPWVWVIEFGVDKSKMAIAVKEESHE